MATISPPSDPPVGLGLTSVILGGVGALLFFLPVLGIPLAAAGVAFGIIGVLVAVRGTWASLRWAVVGIVVSVLALGIGVVIALAPEDYLPTSTATADWLNPPARPYVPPPAQPGAVH